VPLHLYDSIGDSGVVPGDWISTRDGTVKYPVRNRRLRAYLKELKPGRWQKVIKLGTRGEVHYFEHGSGSVAGVKFFST